MASPRHSKTRKTAKAAGFRSGFEQAVAHQLMEANVEFEYEPKDGKILYQKAPSKYLPDFVLSNGIIIEVKGRFMGSDRAKHLLIQKQHPELDIRFIFQADNTLTKVSKTRYSGWCEKHGFKYAFTTIPEAWYE